MNRDHTAEHLDDVLSAGSPALPVHTGPSPWDDRAPVAHMAPKPVPVGPSAEPEPDTVQDRAAGPGPRRPEAAPVLAGPVRHAPLLLIAVLLIPAALASPQWAMPANVRLTALVAIAAVAVVAHMRRRTIIAMAVAVCGVGVVTAGQYAAYVAAPALLVLAGIGAAERRWGNVSAR